MAGHGFLLKGLIAGLLILPVFCVQTAWSQIVLQELSGTVYDSDSLSTLSKVSVRNKRNQELTVSNPAGRFSIHVAGNDTLLFSSIGFTTVELPVAQLMKNKAADGKVKVYMSSSVYFLNPVSFTVKRPPKLDHLYYQKIFTRPKPSLASSPISALYERYSKRGKELRKLESDYNLFEYYRLEMNRFRYALYPEIQDEEEIMKVIMHCKFDAGFVKNAIDYDFNFAVMECLKTYTGK